jgi:histidinol-phosphate aminotransferase
MITAKEPTQEFLQQYLTPSLFSSRGYHIDTLDAEVKLDQNESPWDWPDAVKERILSKLKARPWNRYPPAFGDELVGKIARKIGVNPQNILLGPGSNYLIALVLQTFCKKIRGKVVLARPSFALYESHCQYEGIPYEVWPLDANLEYDRQLLPDLPPGSLLLFASPNNPVGNVLERATLKDMLKSRPDVLFIGDEAYCEFADEPYTELLRDFPNLILIRTFSKTLGAAGIRLGYVLAGANVIDLLKKPRVPFLINQFTLVAAGEVLEDPTMAKIFDDIVANAISERKRVQAILEKYGHRLGFKIKASQANFLLARWADSEASNQAYRQLIQAGILVRNVGSAPGLSGCLRISIGTSDENERLLKTFSEM